MSVQYKRIGPEFDLAPKIQSIQNAVVGPLTSGGKGLFPFEANQQCEGKFAHLRSRRGGQLVDVIQTSLGVSQSDRVVPVALYGGLLINHFGHFIAEGLQRLWPLFNSNQFGRMPIAFHCPYLFKGNAADLPSYMLEVFDYIGVGTERIILIDEPTHFETLYVPTQCSVLGRGWVDPCFTDLISHNAVGRMPAEKRRAHLFIGRQGYLKTGSILGENLLAQTLQSSGQFDAIAPENERIADLVSWYEEAKSITFIEGSAIHTLELCNRLTAPVLVICKGDSQPAKELHFGAMLAQKTGGVRYFDDATRLVPISALPGSQEPYWPHASSYVEFGAVLDAVHEVSGVRVAPPSSDAITSACLETLGRLVLDPRMSHKRMSAETYGKLLLELRCQISSLGLL